ncbi:MAG: SMP-30/gluconolactonase/LRE family protein [Phycisphaerae bacterium]|nr:SMP-30/gluconolactonase/LRE family protein [Phycisphaerae bacterium]
MKQSAYTILLFVGLLLAGCGSPCRCPELVTTEGIIAPGAVLQEISTEFKFTEGPAADADGNVYFTDQPNDRIMVYTADGKLETFMQPAGRSNGLYYDCVGLIYACADENNELAIFSIEEKKPAGPPWGLVNTYKGKRLNGPNDAWIRPKGGIYFTDPFYKRPWWKHDRPPQDVQGVYFLPNKGDLAPTFYNPQITPNEILSPLLVRVIDDMKQPNGIIGTPDGKTLYVADIGAGKTYAYDIQRDGALTGKRLFCEMGSDGMTIDCCGNVYLTGKGVTVFNENGKQIEHIHVPQPWTANATFSGKKRNMLFITAGTGVYRLKMNIRGTK